MCSAIKGMLKIPGRYEIQITDIEYSGRIDMWFEYGHIQVLGVIDNIGSGVLRQGQLGVNMPGNNGNIK